MSRKTSFPSFRAESSTFVPPRISLSLKEHSLQLAALALVLLVISCASASRENSDFGISKTQQQPMAARRKSNETMYFGYGSNLWLEQMKMRCPNSTYLGVAKLYRYRFMINERGYANVVPNDSGQSQALHENGALNDESAVYGLVFSLAASDEATLDINEGVPSVYLKQYLTVDFWESDGERWVDVSTPPEETKTLVYVDEKRVKDSAPKDEYVIRMNMGIRDALNLGVPRDYVDKVMRGFIPPDSKTDSKTQKFAMQQALDFRDI